MTASPRTETRGWRVGRIGGAPVIITSGWALIAVVLVVTFAPWLDAQLDLGFEAYLWALALPVLLLVSVLAHELSHGLTARRFGVPVGEYVITLWGGHTSFTGAIRTPGPSAAISVAGPLANVALALLAAAGGQLTDGVASVAFAAATYSNGFVAVFNLLPALPMDGGKLLEALIWKVRGDRLTGTIVAGRCGQVVAVAIPLVVLGLPLLRGGSPSLFSAIWALLLAGMLWNGAHASVRYARAQRGAQGMDLRALAVGAHLLPAGASVADVDRSLAAAPSVAVVLVDPRGIPVALVDTEALASVPEQGRDTVPAAAVATSLGRHALITQHTGPTAVAQVARAAKAGAATVVVVALDGGTPQVLGLVRVADVAHALAPRRG
ncbi:peptidase M50 [Occultella glacieicola]|uniref:Peptidase M50 n=1 Tax=Occultella glacieicola TaxID=2518684 RepID=A0ABY2E1V5_9MICO|nr:site-2 protease family protein [Occultella glacieicola]TDE90362.1 peptidase M50 [Occultella glacieicola]